MADKKSFILHNDSLSILDEMDDAQAGKLFKAIKAFQVEEEIDLDPIIKMAFIPFRNQFLRDNEKWEGIGLSRSETGRLGGLKSAEARRRKSKEIQANEAIASTAKQTKQNQHVSVNVSVSDNVNTEKNPVPDFETFLGYAKTLLPYKPELDYAIEAKYNSWAADGWKDGHGQKIKNWKTKLQNTITFLKPIRPDFNGPEIRINKI